MTIRQNCPKLFCGRFLSFDEDIAPGTELTCKDGHKSIIAECPVSICRQNRIAIWSGTKVGEIVKHSKCLQHLVVTSMDPVPTLDYMQQ